MTEHKLSFKVPGEPVPTPRPRNPPLAMMIKSKKVWMYSGNKESKAWAKAIQEACPEIHHFDEAEVEVYFWTNKSYDVDNLAKGILDALTGCLWDNDKVVWHLDLCRLECGKSEPNTSIEVTGNEPEHVQAKICDSNACRTAGNDVFPCDNPEFDETCRSKARLLSEKLGMNAEQTHDYLATLEAH